MDEDIKYCENCGSLMERAETMVDFEFKSGTYTVTLEAYYCPKCDGIKMEGF